MTVNAARRPRRRATPLAPEPIIAPAEKFAIGEINQTVFDCPSCARPLALGARRCPGCGTRLIIGIPLSKASVLASAGLAVGILVGGAVGAVFGLSHAAAAPGPVAMIPSAAPVGGGTGTGAATPGPTIAPSPTPTMDTTGSDIPAISRSALIQIVGFNERFADPAATLSAALAAKSFDASVAAQALRALSADAVYGQQLATNVSAWSVSEPLGGRLALLYKGIHDTAVEGLDASVQNVAAYRSTARAMVRLLATVPAVNDEVRSLAAANGLTIASSSSAP